MKKIILRVLMLSLPILFVGCAAPIVKKDMSAFANAAPRSILVVPTVNKSLDVDAPNYVLSTLPVPLAERGYYVFPVNTTKVVLEQEGFYEGERVHQQAPESLARIFGADSILYVTINKWDAKYVVLATTVTVNFTYRMVSKDGVEIFNETKQLEYTPDNSNTGNPLANLLVAAINAAITRAAPNYLPLTRQANYQVFYMGPNPLPLGPYLTSKK